MMGFTLKTQLHYLIHVIDGQFIAHCLDADFVGTGKSKQEAINELNTAVRMLALYAVEAKIFDIMSLSKQAPERYWQMFEQAKMTSGTEEHSLDVCAQVAPVKVKQREAIRTTRPTFFTRREFTYCVAELQAAA
jgi:hypothetical protein